MGILQVGHKFLLGIENRLLYYRLGNMDHLLPSGKYGLFHYRLENMDHLLPSAKYGLFYYRPKVDHFIVVLRNISNKIEKW